MGRGGLICLFLAGRGHAQVFQWANPSGGTWNLNTNWSPTGIPNGAGQSAEIALPGGYQIGTATSLQLDSLKILNAGTLLTVNVNTAITILTGADFVNNGLIYINPSNVSNTAASIWCKKPLTLSGTGTIRVNAANFKDDSIFSFDTLTHQAPHKIVGKGFIAGYVINNNSLIHSDVGGELFVSAVVYNGPSGEIRSTLGSQVTLSVDSGLYGGLVSGDVVSLYCDVSSVTNTGRIAGTFHLLSGGIVNNGTIDVKHIGAISHGLVIKESATISGTGKAVLKAATTDLDDAQIYTTAPGPVLTNGPSHSITGTGRIYVPIINQGTINADVSGKLLEIVSAVTQQGSGIITANKGDACLGAGSSVTGGSFGSVSTGRVRITGNCTIDNVINTGSVTIDRGIVLAMTASGLQNNGTININTTASTGNSKLQAPQSCTISGTGTILLNAGSDSSRARVEAVGTSVLTLGSGQTLRGRGETYGNVISSATISPGATDGALGAISPRGPLTLTAQSRLVIDAVGNGTNQFDGVFSSWPLTLGGDVSFSFPSWSPTANCTGLKFLIGNMVSGKFATYSVNGATPPGKVWRLNYQPTSVWLKLTCRADFDADCSVDDADFVSFVSQYDLLVCADPAMDQYCPADLNSDGLVDDADFVLFAAAYSDLVCP